MGGVGPPWEYIANQQFLYSAIHLPLTCCHVFFLLSLCYVLLLRKSTKTPGTRKFQSTSFLFKSRKRHLSVKEVLPLELSARFLGAAGLLQLATRQSERLTNSQTGLALFPKNNQVQAVEFNGAGYHWNYRC